MTFRFPNIPEREAEFLGLVLERPASINEVVDRVPENAFQNALTRAVWVEMRALAKGGTTVSIPMLRERVRIETQQYGIPDLPSFLATCIDRAEGDMSLSDLADIMAEEAALDSLTRLMRDGSDRLNKRQVTAAELLTTLRNGLDAIQNSSKVSDTMTLADAARLFAAGVSKAAESGQPIGTDWGIKPIDDIAGMIVPGDFIVLGGPSKHGKSSLAHQVCMHVARRLPVLQISAEMSQDQIAGRDILAHTEVDYASVEKGGLQAAELEAICERALDYEGIPYEITFTGDMRVSTIRTRIESFRHRRGGCGLVVVDTIKHVDPEDKHARTKIDKSIASADKLQKLATSLNVPIMVLAQVKRDFYNRPDLELYEDDLYGGGDIVELADTVVLIHQPALKIHRLPNRGQSDESKRDTLYQTWGGRAKVQCTKRRRGKAGESILKWEGSKTRFSDPDDDQGGLDL
ncbi:DnaB-like helicase C-terminal domain-containing protein [Roseibium album]|uniref:DnaB-like helicase C-terminal domain-containing protein n=1 Tax=Roseibium album TaxID=311410 RepID=UPI00391D48BB